MSMISCGRTFQKSGRGSSPDSSIGLNRVGLISAPVLARSGSAAPTAMLAMNALLFIVYRLSFHWRFLRQA